MVKIFTANAPEAFKCYDKEEELKQQALLV